MLKKSLIGLALFVVGGCIAVYIGFMQLQSFANTRIDDTAPFIIHLEKGDSARTVWQQLPMDASSADDFMFKLWLRIYPEYSQVKSGYYELSEQPSIQDVFTIVTSGLETQFSIALVEGLTIRQWLEVLKSEEKLKQDLPAVDDLYDAIVQNEGEQGSRFCNNELKTLEGCLLADTYFYAYQDSALSILRRAYVAMDNALENAWSQRYSDIPVETPYQALILASIIEKETAVASERGVIAGVFSNRLELNMRLQTDPTVIYGIGPDFDGNITRKHLREFTPYNTYRIKGLPPSPIAMAGMPSLMAAVQPEITDYLYFVAKGDGSHQFSATLQAHNAAVAKYQLNR